MAKFDREAFLKAGRQDIANSAAALRAHEKMPDTPYRKGGVNYAFLVERRLEDIAQLEAQLVLANEWLEYLKGKANG